MAIWDRMVGDCMMEMTRESHTTLRQLTDGDAVFTGMYGEVGRCRLYRQDFARINAERIDARFGADRFDDLVAAGAGGERRPGRRA